MWFALCRAIIWSRDTPYVTACMIGHCGVVILPAPLGFPARQLDRPRAAQIHLQLAAIDEHAAPDDLARLADALERAAAQPEVHRPAAARSPARVTADEMRRRHRAGNHEHPDEFLAARSPCTVRPSAHRAAWSPDRSPSPVQTRLVTSASRPAHSSTSLKCGSALPSYSTRAVAARLHRRTIHVVQQPFDQIRCRHQVLQALLILNADRVAAEIVRDAHRGDVHLALHQDLLVGQIRFSGSGPVSNFMPLASSQRRTAWPLRHR